MATGPIVKKGKMTLSEIKAISDPFMEKTKHIKLENTMTSSGVFKMAVQYSNLAKREREKKASLATRSSCKALAGIKLPLRRPNVLNSPRQEKTDDEKILDLMLDIYLIDIMSDEKTENTTEKKASLAPLSKELQEEDIHLRNPPYTLRLRRLGLVDNTPVRRPRPRPLPRQEKAEYHQLVDLMLDIYLEDIMSEEKIENTTVYQKILDLMLDSIFLEDIMSELQSIF